MRRMSEFNDALLASCLEVCLSVPVALVYSPEDNHL